MAIFEKEKIAKEFGVFVREGREKKGIYQADIAEQVGISRAHFTHIEAGDRIISIALAVNICTVLDLDISEFIKRLK